MATRFIGGVVVYGEQVFTPNGVQAKAYAKSRNNDALLIA